MYVYGRYVRILGHIVGPALKSYSRVHINLLHINLKFEKEQENILKIQIQSRHISRRLYECFIGYRPNSIGVAGIERYACECADGRRTVGCCYHIAAIIYYLSHAKYLSKIVRPAEILSKLFTQNNMNPVIEEGSDEH